MDGDKTIAPGAGRKSAGPPDLVAELTHRCPLGCPYCSNPLELEAHADELDVLVWQRVFAEAAALGVRRVYLSGGEPGLRRDLVEIAASAREAGLETNLVTSGVGISTRTMRDLWEAGLQRVQVSFQDSDAVVADHIAGYRAAFQRKHALATEAVRLGLELTVSFVVHAANMERIAAMADLALALKASHIEIGPVEDRGWARLNRDALRPTAQQIEQAAAIAEVLARRHGDRLAIGAFAAGPAARGQPSVERPARLVVTPSGQILLGQVLPGGADRLGMPQMWNVRSRSLAEIWLNALSFGAAGHLERTGRDEEAIGRSATAGPSDRTYRYRR